MGEMSNNSTNERTNLPVLIEGKSIPIPHLALRHLSLVDRYWQFRLRSYRHAYMTRQFQPDALLKQIMIDIHPIFGAYILYIRALELRLAFNFQGALDHIYFAMEWIKFWRVTGSPWDLAQRVYSGHFDLADLDVSFDAEVEATD